MSQTRPAAVAGSFYPDNAAALRQVVDGHLSAAHKSLAAAVAVCPKMLIVPHAGYVYSGGVAALAFAALEPWHERIKRVVLLGPVHRVAVLGLAAPTVDAFETPLGRIPLDKAALAQLGNLPQVVWSDRPHAQEHSLEVQLPMLQSVLDNGFALVPLAVGQASPTEVAEVLERLWGGDETLIVISSDLSHFLPYAQARVKDSATVQRILDFAPALNGEEACGAAPLNGALLAARHHGLRSRLLDLRNSGDSNFGDKDRVVGYAAVAFDPPPPADASSEEAVLGAALLAAARQQIAAHLGLTVGKSPLAAPTALHQPGATFVTLHDEQGQLRGCVGRLEASRSLIDDVRSNAVAAAFHDSRFMPLVAEEWPGLQIEVSVLTPAQPLPARDESDALAALRPGVDGVTLEWHGRHATLLPQVWAQCPQPTQFMAALKHKAGLAADFWAPDLQLSRYQVRSFSEPMPLGDEKETPP